MAVMEPATRTKMVLSLASIAAEPWHPKLRKDRTSLQKLKRTELLMQQVVSRHMKVYHQQVQQSFEKLGVSFGSTVTGDEADRVSRLFLQQLDSDYQGEHDFVVAIKEAYQKPIELGAVMGVKDLPKGYSFQEDTLLQVDWSLLNPDVVAWTADHGSTLVANVLNTSRNKVQAQLLAGLANGESRDDIAKRLRLVADEIPKWRAKQIAQTEIILAHTQGALSVYRRSEVVEGKRWVDGQPNACPLCTNLNNQVIDLDGQFDGIYDGPPRHPGCRCTIAASLTAPEGTAPQPVQPEVEYEDLVGNGRRPNEEFSKKWAEALQTVPATHRDALIKYTSSSYYKMNSELRAGGKPPGVATLDRALARHSLDRNVRLYRGDGDMAGVSIGDVVQDKAFMSTSVRKATAADWASRKNLPLVEVLAPAGTKGAYVASISNYETEFEYVLPRGTSLRVLEIKKAQTIEGRTLDVYTVEVVP